MKSLTYGMAVSNHDWRTDQRYRNVKEALEAAKNNVRVITTDQGWPAFPGVYDVICKANIEEYIEIVGLGPEPATMAAAPEQAPTPATDVPAAPGPTSEAAETARKATMEAVALSGAEYGMPEAPEPASDAVEPSVERQADEPETPTPIPASKDAIDLIESTGINWADVPHAGDEITVQDVRAFLEPAADTPDDEDATGTPDGGFGCAARPINASKNAIALAAKHNIDLASVPHKGAKITVANVKAAIG